MKTKSLMVMAIVVAMFIGQVFVTDSIARGPMMGGQGGRGGCAALQTLSTEDQAKVTAEQMAFLAEVQPLIDQVQQKALALRSEMLKTAPDKQIAFALQKEISDFQAQIDQKRLQHQFNLISINSAFATCGGGFGGGMGGFGGGMGIGINSNCPSTL